MTSIAHAPNYTDVRKKIDMRSGDTVRVFQKIQEKGKTRLQVFEGLVIARKHGTEPGATFTVRKVASGVGVEKIFPLFSPMIDKVEIVRRAKVRKAKLYYIRTKVAKEIRRKMRGMEVYAAPQAKESLAPEDMEPDVSATELAKEETSAETVVA